MPQAVALKKFPTMLGDKGMTREGKSHHPTKWSKHQFNCFDGEGMDINGKHRYVYLAAYDGEQYYQVKNEKGLTSEQCFKFLIMVAQTNPMGINVIYGGSYDANMMLRDVSVSALLDLWKYGSAKWGDWRIQYIPRKEFTVIHIPSKRACKLWDVIGFFQNSFIRAIKQWLDVTDDTITKGKASRHDFNLAELGFIIDYCKRELVLFESLMQRLWETLHGTGIKLSRWDGAGAAAQAVLNAKRVHAAKGCEASQEQHYLQARCAYAGGRFELVRPGDYRCTVYNYDINSAYPYAMSLLPAFTGLRKCRKKHCEYGPYDLLKIRYDSADIREEGYDYVEWPFHPYHHRSAFHVFYPGKTIGWHWGIEYLNCGKLGEVVEHLHWDDTGQRPFAWINDYYQYRYDLKAAGNKAEFAIKLVINSLYGKTAQQRGWRPETDKKPRFHQLYWAGWVTAYTRSMMYQAMMQDKKSVIAVETDGLFCFKPRKLVVGKGLGEWGLTTYQDMTYVQSGMYFGTDSDGKEVTRYRGLDPGQLTRDMVLTAWEAGQESVIAKSTRFRTLGTSLMGGKRLNSWQQWMTEDKEVKLLPQGKRIHTPFCKMEGGGCDAGGWGYGRSHATMAAGGTKSFGKQEESEPYNVLWADMADKLEFWHQLEIDEERFINET